MPPIDYAGVSTTFHANIPIPVDGDRASEKIFGATFRKNADRTAYLNRRLPRVYSDYHDAGTSTAIWLYDNSETLDSTVPDGFYVDVTGCAVGDKVHVDMSSAYERAGSSLTVDFNAYIDVIDQGQAQAHVSGAHWASTDHTGLGSLVLPLSLSGVHTVAAAGTSRFFFALISADWTTDTFKLWSSISLSAVHYPQ